MMKCDDTWFSILINKYINEKKYSNNLHRGNLLIEGTHMKELSATKSEQYSFYLMCGWRLRRTCSSSVGAPASASRTCWRTTWAGPPWCRPETGADGCHAPTGWQALASSERNIRLERKHWALTCGLSHTKLTPFTRVPMVIWNKFPLLWYSRMRLNGYMTSSSYDIHVLCVINNHQWFVIYNQSCWIHDTELFYTPCLLGLLNWHLACWWPSSLGWGSQVHTFAAGEIMDDVTKQFAHICFLPTLAAHLDFKEGAAEGGPAWNDPQEVEFGLLHRDAALLVVGGDDVLQGGEERESVKVSHTGTSHIILLWYLLPVFFGHEGYLVCRNQLTQHPGDHNKLRPVRVHVAPEQQPSQVDHVLSGALVEATQILGQLLHRSRAEDAHHNGSDVEDTSRVS